MKAIATLRSRGLEILSSFAIVALALRFFNLGGAPFILDEPKLQLLIDEAFQKGEVPLLGLLGSSGVRYGPTAAWIYSIVRFFTDRPEALAATLGATIVVAILLLSRWVERHFDRESACWFLALAASSPVLFFYSRTSWDNPFLILLLSLMLLVLEKLIRSRFSIFSSVLLGVLLGLIFNLHFMALGTCGIFVTLTYALARSPATYVERLRSCGIAGAAALLVVLPYLLGVSRSGASVVLTNSEPSPFLHQLRALWFSFLQSTQSLSSWKIEYFLDRVEKDFHASLSPFAGFWIFHNPFSWFLRVAALVFSFHAGLSCWKSIRNSRSLSMEQLWLSGSLLSWGALLLVFEIRGAQPHPHYYLGIWWVIFLLVGLAIGSAKGRLKTFLRICGALTLALNLALLLTLFHWIAENEGTRGTRHGSSVREIRRVVNESCTHARSKNQSSIWMDNSGVAIFTPSLEYFFAHERACSGISLHFNAVPLVNPTRLRYPQNSKTDARIEVLNPES